MRVGKLILCLLACPFVCMCKMLGGKHPGNAFEETVSCR